jgi:hypothetical protein
MVSSVDYRYIVTDLVTNAILAEIPFQGVSWERGLRRAGSFSGSIPVASATAHLNLYTNTMPGRTGLYILREGKCVWGGIIWSRSYDPASQILTVDGAEFLSYLYHRSIWKTRVYANAEPIRLATYTVLSNTATFTTATVTDPKTLIAAPVKHGFSVGDAVYVNLRDANYTDLTAAFNIVDVLDEYTFTVYTEAADKTLTTTTVATAQRAIDNFTLCQRLISEMSQDFAGISIDNWRTGIGPYATLSCVSMQRTSDLVTLVLDDRHDLIVGQEIRVQDVDSTMDGLRVVVDVPSENAVVFVAPGADVVETTLGGLRKIAITSIDVTKGVGTIKTGVAHGASVGNEIIIDTGANDQFDGLYQVASVVDTTTLTYNRSKNDSIGFNFRRIIGKQWTRNGSTSAARARITTETAHGYSVGDTVVVRYLGNTWDGTYTITAIPSSTTFEYNLTRSFNVVGYNKNSSAAYFTIYTKVPHGMTKGDSITISGVETQVNGSYTIRSIPTTTSITVAKTGLTTANFTTSSGTVVCTGPDIAATTVTASDNVVSYVTTYRTTGGLLSLGQRVHVGGFGSVTAQADPFIEVVDPSFSGFTYRTLIYRGYETRTVGEVLEEVSSDPLAPFEYRIDCEYDAATDSFKRKFVLFGFDKENIAELAKLQRLDQFPGSTLVFEYPGQITSFNCDESAEDAATRMFVVGNNPALDESSAQPYAVAIKKQFLDPGYDGGGWPLLDQSETAGNLYKLSDLAAYSLPILAESLPPLMDLTIDLNGSVSPLVGTFNPGDWCVLIINDPWIQQRLASPQEPRKDVLLRRIDGFKVSVPDGPHVLETVSLDLLLETEVDDYYGEQA